MTEARRITEGFKFRDKLVGIKTESRFVDPKLISPMGQMIDKFYRESVIGISQSELAELTGVSQSSISMHENGLFSVTAHAAYFDIGVEEFVEWMEKECPKLLDVISGKIAVDLHSSYPDIVPLKQGRYKNEVNT